MSYSIASHGIRYLLLGKRRTRIFSVGTLLANGKTETGRTITILERKNPRTREKELYTAANLAVDAGPLLKWCAPNTNEIFRISNGERYYMNTWGFLRFRDSKTSSSHPTIIQRGSACWGSYIRKQICSGTGGRIYWSENKQSLRTYCVCLWI